MTADVVLPGIDSFSDAEVTASHIETVKRLDSTVVIYLHFGLACAVVPVAVVLEVVVGGLAVAADFLSLL